MKKPALLIGSGPSVDKIDPKYFDHFETYGCNSIFKKFEEWGRPVDNVVITDSKRMQDIGDAYKNYEGRLFIGDQRYVMPPYKKYKRLLGRDFIPLKQLTKNTFPENWLTRLIPFSKYLSSTVFQKWNMTFDYERGLNFGRSVSCAMVQIAAIEGHKIIALTGVDANYDNPKSYFSDVAETVSHVNVPFVSNPRLMMEPFFVMAQILLEPDGIRLIDCTPGGKLKFIEKSELNQLLGVVGANS
ncbi:MAG: hypothetical protein ACPGN3_00955 [Opitutales bacterium]